MGVSAAQSKPKPSDLDTIHVVHDESGEVLQVVDNPSSTDFEQLHTKLGDKESMVTPNGCIIQK